MSDATEPGEMTREELEDYCAELENALYSAERSILYERSTSPEPERMLEKAHEEGEILAFVRNEYDG